MAATAQDASAPLRGPEKKEEDREEDSELALAAFASVLLNLILVCCQQGRHQGLHP